MISTMAVMGAPFLEIAGFDGLALLLQQRSGAEKAA
jgi:hypothetical protein